MELLLNKQEVLDLGKNCSGIKIVCSVGCCWITCAGDSRDHFLRAGENFTVEHKGQLLVVAMRTTRLMLVRSAKNKSRFFNKITTNLASDTMLANM